MTVTGFDRQIGIAAALSAGIIWGFLGFFVREMDAMGMTPMQMTCMRYIVVTVAVGAFILMKDRGLFRTNRNSFAIFLVMGVVGAILNSTLYFSSMSYISLSLAAVLQCSTPFVVVILAIPILHERLTRTKMLAIVGSFIGCVLCTGVLTAEGPMDLFGIAIAAISCFCYSTYIIGSKIEAGKGTPLATILFYTSLICVIGLLPICDFPAAVSLTINDPSLFALIVGSGLLVTLLPFLLFNYSLTKIEAGEASIYSFVEPMVATIAGLLFYNEVIDITTVAGIFLILVSLIFLNRRGGRRGQDPDPE